jgi:hypothetical protein
MRRLWTTRVCGTMGGRNDFFYRQAEIEKPSESVTKVLKPIIANELGAVPV